MILLTWSEAQKKAEVAGIEYEQRIMEKESMKKMSSIEGKLKWAFEKNIELTFGIWNELSNHTNSSCH